jgi:hypothetical protein
VEWGAVERPSPHQPRIASPTSAAISTTEAVKNEPASPRGGRRRRVDRAGGGPDPGFRADGEQRAVQDLINELGRRPGIGPDSAQRIAFHRLEQDKVDALRLASTLAEAKERVTFCQRCFSIAEGEACGICADPQREDGVLCVVDEPRVGAAIGLQSLVDGTGRRAAGLGVRGEEAGYRRRTVLPPRRNGRSSTVARAGRVGRVAGDRFVDHRSDGVEVGRRAGSSAAAELGG